jgi:hypothetical protein
MADRPAVKQAGRAGSVARRMASVVAQMRRARRLRRLGSLEWFEIAYRVYLAALVGGGVVLWLSGLVSDDPATASQIAALNEHGPAVIGAGAALAIAFGLRSGSDGGPISIEPPDVRHLLMAPVPRREVLTRPVVQRLRSMAFTGLLAGAIAGHLAARRLPGSSEAWAASGGIAFAAMGALFVAVAVIVHVLHLPRWLATGLALVVLIAQGFAIAGRIPGPGDSIGSFALWGLRVHPVDIVGIGVVVALGIMAIALAGNLRVEPLVRRGDLVSQLRFAVTMQDLRTVVLLRRQLRGEQPRVRPWLGLRPTLTGSPARAVWQRGWRGLLRYPLARLTRMAALAIAAGVSSVAVLRGTTPALVGIGVALYLLGLDAVEPLSQEIDHPDHTDGVPIPRGWMMAHHIAAPALALVPFAFIGAATVIVFEPDLWWGALAMSVPITWVGVSGAVISIVRDSPDPLAPPTASSAAVPPEFAGFTSTIRLLYPLVISAACGLGVLAAREQPDLGTVVRMDVALLIVAVAITWWVRRRDEWRTKIREFLDAGRAAGRTAS